ncbi:TIGR03943 family putative permease subunit [Verrucomicrobiota bacterium sgz303538]
MSLLLSRWLPGVTLAAWSVILLQAYFAGRVADLLAPAFRPGVLIAGLAMAVMALLALFRPVDAECCAAGDCSHPLSRSSGGKLLTFAILVLPIVAAALFSKDEFSKTAMLNRGIITDASTLMPPGQKSVQTTPPALPLPTKDGSTAADTSPAPAAATTTTEQPAEAAPTDYLQRTPEGYIVAEVLDLLYAAQDNALRKDFEGKTVQLIGQLMPDATSNAKGNRFKAVRMFMTCCAADARPIATIVETNKLPDVPEMTWIKIVGTSTFPVENGKRTAVLKADVVEKTDPPEETMLY